MAIRLLQASLHLRQNKLQVLAEDRMGKKRLATMTWLQKERTNAPPVFWPDSIEGEFDFQDGEAEALREGKRIPFKVPSEGK